MRTYIWLLFAVASFYPVASIQAQDGRSSGQREGLEATASTYQAVIDRYCVSCHSDRLQTANLSLESVALDRVEDNADIWEKVLVKLRTKEMPPAPRPKPTNEIYASFVEWLETSIDEAAQSAPAPGRPTIRRLNRIEYVNAIRDLLAVEIDGAQLLPADNMAYGFDNNADMQQLSSGLLERYMSAASQVGRLAVGDVNVRSGIRTYKVPRMDAQVSRASETLAFGTRGGTVIRHHFPVDGEYVVRIHAHNSIGGGVRPPSEPEQLEISLDGVQLRLFTLEVSPEGGRRGRESTVPEVRFRTNAGPHDLGVTFVERLVAPEGLGPSRLPVSNVTFRGERGMETRVGQVEIEGPFGDVLLRDTPSRRKIFSCRPENQDEEEECAIEILENIARRAYRRPVTEEDRTDLLGVFRAGLAEGNQFDLGIRWALERILIDPDFLYRVESDPDQVVPGAPYQLTDLQLASRLSFFLWSTIPDEELFDAAVSGRLSNPLVLEQQVRRMLGDARSATLASNFAGQWLHLRNLRAVAPDVNAFPEFDDNLREAFRRETELFFEDQLRKDRSVVDLLTADYSFLNERLARHYGVSGVYGSRFRRVSGEDERRNGLLGHGSVLTVTSYATRTSPVLRGKWLLENILGAPPPPPPPDVPELEESGTAAVPQSMRQRMERHRANVVCASCHARMDPLGFALENFDAIGKWRDVENGGNIDASATLPNGASFEGPIGLRRMLENRSEEIVTVVIRKLMTYALGRGVDFADMPSIRRIVRETASDEYRWSSVLLGVVKSVPFQMRRAAS